MSQQTVKPEHLLVLDIETVPQHASYAGLPETWKMLWNQRVSKTMPENTDPATAYTEKAGIHAEFARIVCIGTGFFYTDKGKRLCFRVQSFAHDDEKVLLQLFLEKVQAFVTQNPLMHFAGHNIREFDIPFLCRRLMINDIEIPGFLQFSGRKPWEVNVVDTLQLWKFGDYKAYTSLQLLAACLGIETPKSDMDGSMVRDVYYIEHDLERIAAYCRADVIAIAQILLRFLHLPALPQANIFVAA